MEVQELDQSPVHSLEQELFRAYTHVEPPHTPSLDPFMDVDMAADQSQAPAITDGGQDNALSLIEDEVTRTAAEEYAGVMEPDAEQGLENNSDGEEVRSFHEPDDVCHFCFLLLENCE